MFDLPVDSAEGRKAATEFRNNLKDLGFSMTQYSVYLRHTSGQRECEALTSRIAETLPKGGCVYVHCLTDRQYENIVRFEGGRKAKAFKNPDQFALF